MAHRIFSLFLLILSQTLVSSAFAQLQQNPQLPSTTIQINPTTVTQFPSFPTLPILSPTDPCVGISKIVIDGSSDLIAATTIQNALNNFQQYLIQGIARLCFQVDNEPVDLIQSLEFTIPSTITGVTSITIDGLDLQPFPSLFNGSSLLTINSSIPVTLNDLTITNADNGVLLQGGAHQILNSDMSGSGAASAGIGIDVQSDGCKVINSHVSNFGTGIRIDGNNTLLGADRAEDYATEKNEIYLNGQGIHLVKGSNNYFAFNNLYENKVVLDTRRSDTGIIIDPSLNIGRPVVQLIEQNNSQALRCEKEPGTERVTLRYVDFQVPEPGTLILYRADDTTRNQGLEFLSQCEVDFDGRCFFSFPSSINISPTECGIRDFFAVALFTSVNHPTTMYTSEKFLLDGVISSFPIVALPLPVPTPGATNEPEPQQGNVGTGDSVEISAFFESTDDERDTSASAAAGAASGCAASITASPAQIKSVGYVFFILLTTFTFVRKKYFKNNHQKGKC